MKNLEYKVGGLKIDPKRIHFEGYDPYDASHLFVVQALENSALIYVAPSGIHSRVARLFDLKENIVGGGSCYINAKNELVVGDYSGDYDAIPENVALIFAELIQKELIKKGIKSDRLCANPGTRLNDFWKE